MPTQIINKALDDLSNGKPILIFDSEGREEETDIVVASEFITSEHIRLMRKDGGGLICTTLPGDPADTIGLPFLVDVFKESEDKFPLLNMALPDHLPYDTKSAFSLTINHKSNYTGITDIDRATTASEFGKFVGRVIKEEISKDKAREIFCDNFRIPGHLHLLRTSEELLNSRKGHTELSTALCCMAGVTPSATICEMMGDDGKALSIEAAKEYAREHEYTFLEGNDIIKEWNEWSK